MEDLYVTLQDFLTHTKSIAYVLIIATLICLTGFWNFLTGRDDD